MTLSLTGSVTLEVKRSGESAEEDVVPASAFGEEEGGPQQIEAGQWRYGAILKAFRDGYALQLTVDYMGSSERMFELKVVDKDPTIESIKELDNDLEGNPIYLLRDA